jgi:signal transduction histidine kinase
MAGVASGIADHLRVPRLAVRIAFLVLLAVSGIGAALYAVFWAAMPRDPAERVRPGQRDRGQLVAFIALAAGLQILLLSSGGGIGDALVWSVAVVAVGVGLIWRRAGAEQRRQWSELVPRWPWLGTVLASGGGWQTAIRLVAGGGLVAVGLVGVLVFSGQASVARDGLIFGSVLLAGVAVVVGPGLVHVLSTLNAERAERIRSQERAEIAGIVHDQVLHTLALIQRRADDPREVARLARGQERDLRQWLYKPTASPTERFRAALDAAAAEVEDTYAITVDEVVVGDVMMDEHVMALVSAAREAMVNAARHAEVATISLYAEVEETDGACCLSVFVRDRGTGFDLALIPDDRHGVNGSIMERMRRHGGRVEVRTAPGQGTEVRLFLDKAPDAVRPSAASDGEFAPNGEAAPTTDDVVAADAPVPNGTTTTGGSKAAAVTIGAVRSELTSEHRPGATITTWPVTKGSTL